MLTSKSKPLGRLGARHGEQQCSSKGTGRLSQYVGAFEAPGCLCSMQNCGFIDLFLAPQASLSFTTDWRVGSGRGRFALLLAGKGLADSLVTSSIYCVKRGPFWAIETCRLPPAAVPNNTVHYFAQSTTQSGCQRAVWQSGLGLWSAWSLVKPPARPDPARPAWVGCRLGIPFTF